MINITSFETLDKAIRMAGGGDCAAVQRYINGDGGAGYGYKDGEGWLFNNRRRNCTDYGCNQETFVGSQQVESF